MRDYLYEKRIFICALMAAMVTLSSNIGYYFGYQNGSETIVIKPEFIFQPVAEASEPVVEEEPVEVVEEIEEPKLAFSDSEIDLIALITMAEAEGESELGKRLVIDVILNRVDSKRFPNTVNGVIYAQGQFECIHNGRLNRCYVRDDIRELVIDEMQNRTRSDIHYFRAGYYHGFGTPITYEGNHYFSTY